MLILRKVQIIKKRTRKYYNASKMYQKDPEVKSDKNGY